MRLLEDAGDSPRGDARDRASSTVDVDADSLSFGLLTTEFEFDTGPKPFGRPMFAVKMIVAIVLACTAITLFPDGRPDHDVVAQSLYVRAGVSPSVPPTSSTLPTPHPTAFLVDLSAINAVVAPVRSAGADAGASDSDPATVEPEISAVEHWVDSGNGVAVPDVLLRIRFCESTNNYGARNRVSTASGGYQFLNSSWAGYGHAQRYGVGAAHQALPAQQDEAALLTLQQSGLRPWAASRSCWADPNINPRYATLGPPATTTTTVPPTTAPPSSDPPTTGEPTPTTSPTTAPTSTTLPSPTSTATTAPPTSPTSTTP